MRLLYGVAAIMCSLIGVQSTAQAEPEWPYPFPCRVQDGANRDLMFMTLGNVDTPVSQGVYDPVADKVTLKDGTVKENYYRDVLGIAYYKPMDKKRYPLPPSGWCTWYYYYQRITATEVKRNAKWIADNLKDYGARFVQIDDGWQGGSRDWTVINEERFPEGMADVAAYIKSLGLTPGIWLAPHGQSNEEVVKANPNVFLLESDGTSASDTWEGKFLVDPSTPESSAYMKAIFSNLCDWGYEYFKIDGQPIVVDEYRDKKSFMKNPEDDTNGLYRRTLEDIREVLGPDRYLLGCWGVPIEGVGIMDGSRTGGDIVLGWGGFQTALRAVMACYYQHNIVWYTDPDVMLLRSPLPIDQARVWATLQGITGQGLMATDRMMDLSEDRVEMLRRVYPAVDIRPLDLFPSERNKRIWDLKINHLGRSYDVVGVFNFDETSADQIQLKWADMGLPSDVPMHVFDFWNKEYLGAWEAGMAVDVPPTNCRVLTVTAGTGKIQLISTSRHITQGWVDLVEQSFDDESKVYKGKSRVIKNDPYEIRFAFPRDKNFMIKSVGAQSPDGPLPATFTNHQGWAKVKIESPRTTEVSWEVAFESTDIYHYPPDNPEGLRVEREGLDGVKLTWREQYFLNVGYQVYLDGKLHGYTPRACLTLRGLDPKEEHKVAVATVWEDGSVVRERAEQSFTIQAMLPRQMPLSWLKPISSGSRWRRIINGPVSIGEQSFQDGIIMRPGLEALYEVKALYTRLTAQVGIGNESNLDDGIEFVLMGDGKELWRSGSLKKADGAKTVEADISGIASLVLRAEGTEERGRRSLIQAAWVDVTLKQ